MILSHMTWAECAQVDWKQSLAVVPLGSIEQHGPHLPCDTDTLLVTAIAEETERRLAERVMLCPTIWLGHSPHHVSFGGTLSAHHAPYTTMLVEVLNSLRSMGCMKVFLLNGHGGNRGPAAVAMQELKDQDPRCIVMLADYWALAARDILSISTSGMSGMGHAGELETSLYMHLCPHGVQREKIRDAGRENCPAGSDYQGYMFQGTSLTWIDNFEQITDTGVFGKPTHASAEKGARFFDVITDAVERCLGAIFASWKEEMDNGKG